MEGVEMMCSNRPSQQHRKKLGCQWQLATNEKPNVQFIDAAQTQ